MRKNVKIVLCKKQSSGGREGYMTVAGVHHCCDGCQMGQLLKNKGRTNHKSQYRHTVSSHNMDWDTSKIDFLIIIGRPHKIEQ